MAMPTDTNNESPMRPFRLPPSPLRIRRGISLIEVLISMFVLLFGLMGVAAIFPVASHYVLEGDKRDRSAGLAQVAFEELKARKILRPETWLYSDNTFLGLSPATDPAIFFVNPLTGDFSLNTTAGFQVGGTFVIDPLGTAAVGATANRDIFPFSAPLNPPLSGWLTVFNTLNSPLKSGTRWPVRRLTLNVNPNLAGAPVIIPGETAKNTFTLRDDLAVVQPKAGDRPSIQRWQIDNNGTPANPSDDTLLARDYLGDYSWLATVVPANTEALLGLAPINNVRDAWYEVSTAVFYKREIVPTATVGGSAGSERLINGEFLNSSELAIYDPGGVAGNVDTAVDGLKPGNWVAVMGVNNVTGAFLMKWYKVLAIDDETNNQVQLLSKTNPVTGRYVMVQGPPWPTSSYQNLGVAILPGIVDVYTRVMQMETN
jgi:hypothetical protein